MRHGGRSAVCALSIIVLELAAGPSLAQGSDAVRMDLRTAVWMARNRSPTLEPSRAAAAGVADVRAAASASLPTPPRLELQVGPRLRSEPERDGFEASVAAWQDVSLGGYRRARREFASSMEDEARAAVSVAARDAGERAAVSWVSARLASELQRIRGDSLKEAEELLRIAAARVESGRAAPGEESFARALVGSARAAVLEAEGRKFAAEAELRFATGLGQSQPLAVVGDIDARDAPLDEAELVRDALANHPDVTFANAAAHRRDRAAELALASGRPFLAVGPLVTHEGTGDWIIQARVAMPLPFVNPNALDAARARAEALAAHAETTTVRAALDREIRIALHEREHSREARDVLRDGAIRPAREALVLVEKQYAAGAAPIDPVVAARRQLLEAEEKWAEAAAGVKLADIKLARALGRDIGDERLGGGP